ncbi:MAG: hypothetical protein MJA83_05820 [Gammaproteobacteria bacterium]|nr:hypothetical protein [Gammaproteobacteria bacterium]
MNEHDTYKLWIEFILSIVGMAAIMGLLSENRTAKMAALFVLGLAMQMCITSL